MRWVIPITVLIIGVLIVGVTSGVKIQDEVGKRLEQPTLSLTPLTLKQEEEFFNVLNPHSKPQENVWRRTFIKSESSPIKISRIKIPISPTQGLRSVSLQTPQLVPKPNVQKYDLRIEEKLNALQSDYKKPSSKKSSVAVLIYIDPSYFKGRDFSQALGEIEQKLLSHGVMIKSVNANPIKAVVSTVEELRAIGELPFVSYIRDAEVVGAVTSAGSITSQGVYNVSADYSWMKGYDGRGIRVGVLDPLYESGSSYVSGGGFSNYQNLVAQGELPSNTYLYPYHGAGEGSHGSAVAEILYDTAPGIDAMYLGTYNNSVEEMYNAVNWFIQNGVRVIAHPANNFAWWPTYFDSDGDGNAEFWDVYKVVNYSLQSNVVWVNAAGDMAYSHWEGPWKDQDGDGYLDIYGTPSSSSIEDDREAIQIILNSNVSNVFQIWVRWSDYPYPNGAPTNDFDIYLQCDPVTFGNRLLWLTYARSIDYQNGTFGQEPLEYIGINLGDYGLDDGQNHYCRVYVQRYNAPNADQMYFDIWWKGHAGYWYYQDSTYDPRVVGGSVEPPADMPYVLTTGSVLWENVTQIEGSSARGPAYNPYLGNGNWLKPNVVGPTGVSTATSPIFTGTSAATGHVAGVAADLLSAQPALSSRTVWAILQLTARDIPPEGVDLNTGYGLVNASDATPQALRWRYPTPENSSIIDVPELTLNITTMFKSLNESNLTLNGNVYPMSPQDEKRKVWSYQASYLSDGEYNYSVMTVDSFNIWRVYTSPRKFYVNTGVKNPVEGIDGDSATGPAGGWVSSETIAPNSSAIVDGVFVWKDSSDGGFESPCTGLTYDIQELQLTADGNYIYVLIKLNGVQNFGRPPAPLVGVGFDIDNDGNIDYRAYAFLDKIGVSEGSAEFLDVYDASWKNVATASPEYSVFVVSGNAVEMQIPRSIIGNPSGTIGLAAWVYEGLGAGTICNSWDVMTDNGNTLTSIDLTSVPFFSSAFPILLSIAGLVTYFKRKR